MRKSTKSKKKRIGNNLKNISFEKLNVLLDDAVISEELAIPLYVSHIEKSLFWSGLAKQKQKEIIFGLKILARESKIHVLAFKKVKELIKK